MKPGLVIAATIIVTAGLYFFIEVGMPQILVSLANKDKWWSPLRMRPSSGQYAIMSWGDNKGPMAMIIHDIPGHYLDDSDPNKMEWAFKQGADPRGRKDGYLGRKGIEWVGFNKAYYLQKVEYDVWDKKPGSTEYGMVSKTRNAKADDPYYYFQYTMAAKAVGVETSGKEVEENFPVDMVTVFTGRHRYPVKVQFFAGRWALRITAAVETVSRLYGNSKTFNELQGQTGHENNSDDEFVKMIKSLGDPKPSDPDENLTKKFGLEVDDPNFVSVEITPGSQADKIAEATTALGVETKLADAKEQKARGIRAESRARVEGGGEHAGTFALAEAIKENTTATTLVIGNTNIAVPTK